MIDQFKSWKLIFDEISEESLITYVSNIIRLNIPNTSYTLSKKLECFSTVEKLVYDIFNYLVTNHLNGVTDDYDVEFWLKPFDTFNTSRYHFDTDDYNQSLGIPIVDSAEPVMTSILYFSDNDVVPTMVTDIQDKTLDPKNLIKCNQLILSLPRTFKLITFNGGKYLHGDCKLTNDKNIDRNILALNIWKSKDIPIYIPKYNYELIFFRYCCTFEKELINDKYSKEKTIFTLEGKGCTNNLKNDTIFDNIDMFLMLPYKMDLNLYNPIKRLLDSLKCKCDNFNISRLSLPKDRVVITDNNLTIEELIKNDKDLINFDFSHIKNSSSIYNQRYHCPSFYRNDVIQFLLLEIDYKENKDYVEIESFSTVFKFLIISYTNAILPKLNNVYNINNDNCLQIKNGYFVRMLSNENNSLKKDINKEFLTIYILVDCNTDSNSCKFWFEHDNMIYELKCGDFFVCKSSNNFYILPYKGKTYWLILYLNDK